MSNASTVSVTTATAPSAKLVDFLIRSNVDESLSLEENYRRLIEATYTHATVERRKHVPAVEVAARYAQHSEPLVKRIEFAQEHARNTLRKMVKGYPDSLSWAYARGAISITGIFRGGVDITAEINSGATEVHKHDVVRFVVGTTPGELPVGTLTFDPIAPAQIVRKKCKVYVSEKEREAAAAAVKDLEHKKREFFQKERDLNKKLKEAQEELDEAIRLATPKPPKVKKPDSRLISA